MILTQADKVHVIKKTWAAKTVSWPASMPELSLPALVSVSTFFDPYDKPDLHALQDNTVRFRSTRFRRHHKVWVRITGTWCDVSTVVSEELDLCNYTTI